MVKELRQYSAAEKEGFEDFINLLVQHGIEYRRAAGDLLISWKFKLAEEAKAHFFFQKHQKGNMTLVAKAVEEARKRLKGGISVSSFYDALQVSSAFKSPEELVEKLAAAGKPINWTESLTLLGRLPSKGLERSGCQHVCKFCGEKYA